MSGEGEEAINPPLFETKLARGRAAYKLLTLTIFFNIILTWIYRFINIPSSIGKYAWIAMLFAEISFGLYWIITQAARWRVVYRYPFKDRLSSRYEEKLPRVDVFVCTADPVLEPPSLVINTVLSVMAYNYPPEKLSVYLSDDGGSELTFYALIEASEFSKHWIPFCKKFNVEPRSPEVYFAQSVDGAESIFVQQWNSIKKLYEEMKTRIDLAAAKGCISKEITNQHKGFSEWSSSVTKQDHQSIVQILIDGWNPGSVAIDGSRLPTLVYLSREKRPGSPHNFKAGSMNSLIRVSSEISNGPIILNVDCDMYSSDPDAIRDALCFFMDETEGHRIAFIQHPQNYNNTVKNDVYANVNFATNQIELSGLDGYGGALYCGTGCFHRRESLSGKKYSGSHIIEGQNVKDNINNRSIEELEKASKVLANCSYEKGSLWGKEMGLVYGCPVEDIVTGLTIQCRGWISIYYNPIKHAFQGIAPTTLDIALIQFKRWSEGMFQIFISKYCPFIYGHGRIKLGAQMGYCVYLLWAPISVPTLCYLIILPLCLLHKVPLFPQMSSVWVIPFAYVAAARTVCTLVEDLICGGTLRGWWNLQRIVMIRRTTSFLFAFIDTITRQLGLSETSFVVTGKVMDDEVHKRYKKGIIEFGSSSIMSIIIATLALLNLVGLGWGIKNALFCGPETFGKFGLEIVICAIMVGLNLPVYEALFLRSDKGSMPSSVLFKSIVIASVACLVPIY